MAKPPLPKNRQAREARKEAVLADLRAGFPAETVAETFNMHTGWVYALAAANGIPVERRLDRRRLWGFLRMYKTRAGHVTHSLSGAEEDFVAWLVQSTEPGESLADTLIGIAREIYEKERKGRK